MKWFKALLLTAMVLLPITVLAEEPEVVVIDMVEADQPTAIPCACGPVTEYAWTDDEITQVAKILWAETGRGDTYQEKQCICYLILNRTRFGHPFPSDIVSVCKQKGEFNRGKSSDRNRQIARESLNRYQSQLDGSLQGIDFPMTAVYMARNGRTLCFYDYNWNKVYEVRS